MSIYEILLLIVAGIAAGFFNTVAGGGSLITLPLLIFFGLPSSVANGTNRIAIFSQNIFATAGFRSKGVGEFPYSIWLGISALLGAIVGAELAIEIKGELFNKILAVIMVSIVLLTVFKKRSIDDEKAENLSVGRKAASILSFFFVGIYGGFIQAGVGFIIIAVLSQLHSFSLVKTNAIKVFVVLVYTAAALAVFIVEDQIHWTYGIILAVGNSLGGWLASRWSVKKGDKTVSRILLITVAALAVKLWFF